MSVSLSWSKFSGNLRVRLSFVSRSVGIWSLSPSVSGIKVARRWIFKSRTVGKYLNLKNKFTNQYK